MALEAPSTRYLHLMVIKAHGCSPFGYMRWTNLLNEHVFQMITMLGFPR